MSTIDFFYPLVLDPYLQGRIGCANVLSDLYAMGIHNCDNMLMVLAASLDMDPKHRHIVTQEMLRGFADLAKEADTTITGGQTVLNPWPIIGGVAQSVENKSEIIMPENAVPGDKIILTKPLGTQVGAPAQSAEAAALFTPDSGVSRHSKLLAACFFLTLPVVMRNNHRGCSSL